MRGTRRQTVLRDQVCIAGEAEHIIRKARDRDARVVTLGSIAFFSTDTGDAWMLDTEDQLAVCLAREGVKQDFAIVETDASFRIEWRAQYAIRDDAFVVAEPNGRVRTILGYPTAEIDRAIAAAGRGGGTGP